MFELHALASKGHDRSILCKSPGHLLENQSLQMKNGGSLEVKQFNAV
jgi:hypothetical protein